MLDIELGKGNTIVSDVHNVDGKWAGICISYGEARTGELVELEGDTDEEIGAVLRIRSTNPKSLDVVIAACERAKALIPDNSEGS